ncbi:hypothetical protein FEM48_Zijuj04G0083000 [Ziziphus jujuba var. spinosa]|uniref:Uncharacterized protein n=1 Tax=Ziziphus jujuba var. spinosa TaxID=714518 RepID=A0A978VIS9_ZIZJJ|nr:hypothetical protein FEM48_Zijuj04G0083000 [Ziziphus jujuba var. spinosa]
MECIITCSLSSSFVPAINHQRILNPPNQQFAARRSSTISIFSDLQLNPRRSAHYHPSIWETKLIESFGTPYTVRLYIKSTPLNFRSRIFSLTNTGNKRHLSFFSFSFFSFFFFQYELHAGQLEELKQITRRSLRSTKDSSILLNLIDSMQRLGVAYHFENEIEDAIFRARNFDETGSDTLYMTALKFRVLREHGLPVSCAKQVEHSLEIPLRWRMPRAEARNFIDVYQTENGTNNNTSLLELAKLDYNLVQSAYQQELKELASWDMEAMAELPLYMKICYVAMLNFANELVYDVLKSHGFDVLPYIKQEVIN